LNPLLPNASHGEEVTLLAGVWKIFPRDTFLRVPVGISTFMVFLLQRLIADFHQRSPPTLRDRVRRSITIFGGFVVTPADGMSRYHDRGSRGPPWPWDFNSWGAVGRFRPVFCGNCMMRFPFGEG
jgi:hypothetical protein